MSPSAETPFQAGEMQAAIDCALYILREDTYVLTDEGRRDLAIGLLVPYSTSKTTHYIPMAGN